MLYICPALFRNVRSEDPVYLEIFTGRTQGKVYYMEVIRPQFERLAPTTFGTGSWRAHVREISAVRGRCLRHKNAVRRLPNWNSCGRRSWLCTQDDEELWELHSMAEIRNMLRLLCNKVEWSSGDLRFMRCINKLLDSAFLGRKSKREIGENHAVVLSSIITIFFSCDLHCL